MFNQRPPNAPILIVGADIINSAAQHIMILEMRDYYGPERIKVCDDPEGIMTYLADKPSHVVYILDVPAYTKLKNFFDALVDARIDITKVVAFDEADPNLGHDAIDLGEDMVLRFSERYRTDEFRTLLRQVIGPSADDIATAQEKDFSRAEAINGCISDVQADMIDAHFAGSRHLSQLEVLEVTEHLGSCIPCAQKLEGRSNVTSAGIRMLTNRSVHDSNPPGFHTKTVASLRHY